MFLIFTLPFAAVTTSPEDSLILTSSNYVSAN